MLHTQVVTVSVTVRVVPNSKQKKSITKPFKLTTLPPSCTRQHILTSPIKTGEMYGILSVESSRGVGTVIVHVVLLLMWAGNFLNNMTSILKKKLVRHAYKISTMGCQMHWGPTRNALKNTANECGCTIYPHCYMMKWTTHKKEISRQYWLLSAWSNNLTGHSTAAYILRSGHCQLS